MKTSSRPAASVQITARQTMPKVDRNRIADANNAVQVRVYHVS